MIFVHVSLVTTVICSISKEYYNSVIHASELVQS